MSDIRPIQTAYKGYLFRSRLEARWAVCFDALGVRWQYEKEGFELPSGMYLPDFWLPIDGVPGFPNAGYWVEINGEMPTEKEQRFAKELCEATKHTTRIWIGDPLSFIEFRYHRNGHETIQDGSKYIAGLDCFRNGQEFLLASLCSTLRGTGDARDAQHAARSARFEHGESGAPR